MHKKTIMSFNYNEDLYNITVVDYPDKIFLKEKCSGYDEIPPGIDMYSLNIPDDECLHITKNGNTFSEYGIHWAGGEVTAREFVEHIITLYINRMDKSKFSVVNVCNEIEQIKEYYDKGLESGKYLVEFHKNKIYSLDIESKKYIGFSHLDDVIMFEKKNMRMLTDYQEAYLEVITDILDDKNEDILYFKYSPDDLKGIAKDNIKCKLSYIKTV